MQPIVLLAFFATAVNCLLILSLLSTKAPSSLSTQLLPSQVDSSLFCPPGLGFPRCKTIHLSLLNIIRFLLAHCFSISRSSCRVAVPSEVSTFPHSLVSLAKFIWVRLMPSSRSLMKITCRLIERILKFSSPSQRFVEMLVTKGAFRRGTYSSYKT